MGRLRQLRGELEGPVWRASLWRTVWFSVTVVAIELVLGMLLALAMLRPFRGRRVLMTMFVIPLFISPVVVGGFFDLFVRRPYGVANQLTSWVWPGDVTIDFTTDTPWLYIVLFMADVWQWTPFMFVILLAGLAAIPDSLYEAADLDGAKPFAAFRFVTLPLLLPIILIAVTFRLIDAAKLFDIIFSLTRGGPGHRHVHDELLPLPAGVRALPPRPGHRRGVDVHDHALVRLVLARPAAAHVRRGGCAVSSVADRVQAGRASTGVVRGQPLPGRQLRALRLHRPVRRVPAPAALLDGRHVVQVAGRPALGAAGLVPLRPDEHQLRGRAQPLQRLEGPRELAGRRVRDDVPRRALRHCGGVLDGPLPHRRQAPRLLVPRRSG